MAQCSPPGRPDWPRVPGQAPGWPVWSGPVPPLADGFTVRPDTVPDLETALIPGATVVLVPDQAPASAQDWRASSGKTQLARYFAESLWRSPGVDVLTWVVASSRASVLSGFVSRGRGDRRRRRGRCRVGGGPVHRLAQQDRPAVAGRARRPARRGGPAGALAVRPGGQAADHDRQSGGPIRRAPGADAAGAGLQHQGGDGLPVRPPRHGPGPAQRGDRPGAGPRLRADRARPGERGDRQLGHVLPRLPAALHAAAEAARGGGPGRAVGRRGHLDVLGRVRRAPVAGREHQVAGDAGRAARRARDTGRRVHHGGGRRVPRRGRRRPGSRSTGGRPAADLERDPQPQAGGAADGRPARHFADGPDRPGDPGGYPRGRAR